MAFVNNVMIIRRDLLTRLAELYKDDLLFENKNIERIPIEISRRIRNNERCCIHKARSVVKYKLMAIMGFGIEDENDELDTLSYYADQLINHERRTKKFLNVVDEACTSCIKSSYVVTNLCKGCIAQPCMNNCPKQAISRNTKGKAQIDPLKCINCGLCKGLCPYHSIVYLPVPCEESCPTGAIKKDETGCERVDESKCILCGKCVNACPFGSIIETTELFDVMKLLKNKKPVNAIIAPSLFGQFQAHPGAIVDALKKLGFTEVLEAAMGASQTTRHEAMELKEKLQEGQAFMTSSCCPSWMMSVEQHIPEIKPYVSTTPSPMAYTAMMSKKKYPDRPVVFIGPCLAKRKEGRDNPNIDLVMTFEELACILHGWNISVVECDESPIEQNIDPASRKYCISGSVAEAVKSVAGKNISVRNIDGLDKKQLRLLSSFAKSGKADAQLIEVMSCEGGCISGPCNYEFPKEAKKYFLQNMEIIDKQKKVPSE
jgi:[FeFe] hydrogenase (group B1/B3)